MIENKGRLSTEVLNVRDIEVRRWNSTPIAKSPWNVNLVACAVHPGGINTLLPLVTEIVQRGAKTALITGDVATDIVRNQPLPNIPEIKTGFSGMGDLFDPNSTNLFLVSDSAGPEMELETEITLQAVQHRRKYGKTLVCYIEDGTSGLKGNLQALKQHGVDLNEQIDAFFTTERGSAKTYKEFPEISKSRFITTGSPQWDSLRDEQTESENKVRREKMNIRKDALVVVHNAGRGTGLLSEAEIDTTPAVIKGIIKLAMKLPDKEVILMYRFHPGDSQPQVLNQLISESLPSILLENLKINVFNPEQTKSEDGRLFSTIANIVTAANSDSLIGIALRGARRLPYKDTGQMPLYFLSPTVRKQIALFNYSISVAVSEGAALFANSADELPLIMERAIFDQDLRKTVFGHQANEMRNRYRFKGTINAKDWTLLQIRKLLRVNSE